MHCSQVDDSLKIINNDCLSDRMVLRAGIVVFLLTTCLGRRPVVVNALQQNNNDTASDEQNLAIGGVDAEEEIHVSADIVGGSLASVGRYPSYAIPDGSTGLCGSVLIAADMLLTAAHCGGIFLSNRIHIGGNLLDGSDAIAVGYAEREIPHPNFSLTSSPGFQMSNDIMLVQLQSPVLEVPVATWNGASSSPSTGTILKAIGFGKTENNVLSGNLLEVDLQTIELSTCSSYYPNMLKKDQMMCAGTPSGVSGNQRTCAGDSGGPLFSDDSTTSSSGLLVYGLTSFGRRSSDNTCSPVSPGVFTRVSNYDAWIRETVCALSDQVTEEFCRAAVAPAVYTEPMGWLKSIWGLVLGLLSWLFQPKS